MRAEWSALARAREVLQLTGRGLHLPPYAHVPDADLLAALEAARQGVDPGLAPYPGPPSAWPRSGLERLADAELLRRLRHEAADLRGEDW